MSVRGAEVGYKTNDHQGDSNSSGTRTSPEIEQLHEIKASLNTEPQQPDLCIIVFSRIWLLFCETPLCLVYQVSPCICE